MNQKINIVEILKDCPKGTELYSPICGECRVFKIYNHLGFDVINGTDDIFNFSYDGRYNLMGECCIFPSKENRDWSKFLKPFKNGDIIADEHGNIAIYKGTMWYNKKLAGYYCGYRKWDNHFISEPKKDGHFGSIKEIRLATEEEREKLFQAIKDNGYHWNEETKTLDKLIKQKFKIGDKIRHCIVDFGFIYTIIKVEESRYIVNKNDETYEFIINFEDQDSWELFLNKFDISSLKPFESRVLTRDDGYSIWQPNVWGLYDKEHKFPYITTGNRYKYCIPYEGNEHLLGTTKDCDEYYKVWE